MAQGEFAHKNGAALNNGYGIGSHSHKTAKHPSSDYSSKSRSPAQSPKRSSAISPRSRHSMSPSVQHVGGSPSKKCGKPNQGSAKRSLPGSTARKSLKPSDSGHGQDLSRSPSPSGTPKRISKGRGFTERYLLHVVSSPEHLPCRSFQYGGRYVHERNCDRYSSYINYSEHSTGRHYGNPLRGGSPPRLRGTNLIGKTL